MAWRDRSRFIADRPVKGEDEAILAYYRRVDEWERENKPVADKIAASIDSALSKPKFPAKATVTKQTQLDRRSIHDMAQTNPLLRNVLRSKA